MSASDCLHAMNGRWFEERLMYAEYDLESDTEIRGRPSSSVAEGVDEDDKNETDELGHYQRCCASTKKDAFRSGASDGDDGDDSKDIRGQKRMYSSLALPTVAGLKTVPLPSLPKAATVPLRHEGRSNTNGDYTRSSSELSPGIPQVINPYASFARVQSQARPPTPPRKRPPAESAAAAAEAAPDFLEPTYSEEVAGAFRSNSTASSATVSVGESRESISPQQLATGQPEGKASSVHMGLVDYDSDSS